MDAAVFSEEERRDARGIFRVAEYLRELDSEFSALRLSILMHIATNEGNTQRDIADRLGVGVARVRTH